MKNLADPEHFVSRKKRDPTEQADTNTNGEVISQPTFFYGPFGKRPSGNFPIGKASTN